MKKRLKDKHGFQDRTLSCPYTFSVKMLAVIWLVLLFAGAAAQIPPSNLTASAGDSVVDLEWEEPDFGFWLHYDTGNAFTGIGADAQIEFKTAIRFHPDSLAAFNAGNRRLTEVMFIPRFANCVYSINVWVGGTPLEPGELVVDQEVENPIMNSWNTVILDEPLRIDETRELWIGVNYDTQGGHPAGCDNGPEVDGFGNLIFINNNWQTLLQANPLLTYNWSIRGFVGPIEERGDYRVLSNRGIKSGIGEYPLSSINEQKDKHPRRQDNIDTGLLTINPDWESQRTSGEEELYRNDVLGYNVYRDNRIINDELLHVRFYRDTAAENYQEYSYTTTAMYRSGESRMSNAVEVMPTLPNPFGLIALGGNNVVKLRWDSYDHPDLIGFNIYRNNNLINDEPLFNIRYDDEDVVNGTLYSYYIKSVYTGDFESGASNIVQVTPEVLETPHNLQAVVGDRTVFLRWQAPEDEDVTGYIIYKDEIAIYEQRDLTFFDIDVENGREYRYTVTAVYPAGESSASNEVAATPQEFIITPEPHDLTASAPGSSEIRLDWQQPLLGNKLHWDEEAAANTFGTGAALSFKAAVRFTSYDLIEHGAGGRYLTKVFFYPTYFNSTYEINVWTGGDENSPQRLVVEQPVPEYEINAWNMVELENPVYIDISRELWIGISIVTAGGRPIAADAGPAIQGLGNMVFYNNHWSPLTSLTPAYDYNWNIQGFVSFEDDETARIGRIDSNEYQRRHFLTTGSYDRLNVTGYNIYRDQSRINTELITNLFFLDTGLTPHTLYEYHVTAVYEDRESEPSNSVKIEILNINEQEPYLNTLKGNYPNPFNPETTISFILAEKSPVTISIYNAAGQKIARLMDEVKQSGAHRVVWNGKDSYGNSVSSGIYFYKMTTDKYSATRKMIMIK